MKASIHKENYEKLFQSICLAGSVLTLFNLITNIFLSAEKGALIVDAITLLGLFGFYGLSKFKQQTENIFIPFAVFFACSVSSLWFVLGGAKGPVIAVFVGLLASMQLMDSKRRMIPLALLYAAALLAVILVEYFNPNLVTPYKTVEIQLINTAIIGIIMIILITIVNVFVAKMNEEEQKIKEEQSQALKDAKEAAEKDQSLLVTLKDMQSNFFLGEHQLDESFALLMDQLVTITNSEFGYIGEVMYKDGKDPYLQAHAVVDRNKPDSNLVEIQEEIDKGNLHQLFEHVMKSGSYIISNKVPVNRSELKALLGFPVRHHDKIVGMVGVASREGYDEEMVEFLTPFLSTYGTIIQNIRLQRIQKQYEEELFEAKEMAEQAVQAKDLFLTNISHELRTPLTLITGPVSSLLNQKAGTLEDAKIRPSLNMINKNSNKMLQFIEDIMDLAKLRSNKLQVNKNVNNLHDFIEGVYSFFKIQTSYRQIDYRLNIQTPKDLVLVFDTRKVEKILNNLLSNAFKYTKDGGAINLTVSEENGAIKMEVRDTGVGINEEDLQHIFERFYQTKDNKKVLAMGTGVGLALAQDLAQLQGFDIQAKSKVGQGTSFYFCIPKTGIVSEDQHVSLREDTEEDAIHLNPLATEENEGLETTAELSETDNSEASTESIKQTTKPHVLVVEDNPDMREFIQSVLTVDYEVSLAENGVVGLAMLKEHHEQIDLVVTDLMMPEMDGFELMENIKANDWGKSMPIIVLTAKTGQQSKLKALTIGVDEYLTKPFSVNELLIRVKNLMQNLMVRKEWKDKVLEENLEEEGAEIAEVVVEVDPNLSKIDAHQDSHEQSDFDRERIDRAKAVVEEHIDDVEFTVDDLAKAVMMSKRQLYRFMQGVTGLTPLNFIKEIRLQQARVLLEEHKCSTVKEVSYSIGFMSSRHFTKNYLERFGKKPSEYFK